MANTTAQFDKKGLNKWEKKEEPSGDIAEEEGQQTAKGLRPE